MKKIFLIVLSLIVPYLGLTQSFIKVNYNDVYIGGNISIDYDYQISRFLLSIGPTYYFGVNKDKVAFHHFLKDRGAPSNTKQHFGLQFNIGYKIYGNQHFDLFGVYRGSFAYMNSYLRIFKNYAALVPEPKVEEDYALIIKNHEFGPVFSFDNTFGLLFKGKITNYLFLNLQGGVGFTYLKNNDDFFIIPINYKGASFLSTSFSVGLGYAF